MPCLKARKRTKHSTNSYLSEQLLPRFCHILNNFLTIFGENEPLVIFKTNSSEQHSRNSINKSESKKMENYLSRLFENIEAFSCLETKINHENRSQCTKNALGIVRNAIRLVFVAVINVISSWPVV